VGVSIEEELLRDALGQEVEKSLRRESEVLHNKVADITLELARNKLIDLADEDCDFGNELDETLGHKNDTVVLSKLGALADNVGDLRGDL